MTAIVLVHPEIPGNTGSIGRTCVALGIELVLVRPYGFEITDTRLKRAGLDYWQHLHLTEFDSWADFVADRTPLKEQMFLFEDDGDASVYDTDFPENAYLVFGCETVGLPDDIRADYKGREVFLPMRSQHIRSLNLANAATAAVYQAMRGALSR